MTATIYEKGNGFPSVGEYVSGDDGEPYRVISLGVGYIQTGSPGVGNRIEGCEVELADWRDVYDDPVSSAVLDS